MTTQSQTAPDSRAGWSLVGPGLIVAATGVGAADLVATVIAGQRFGYALLWAVIVGCLMKVVLVEGAGRYSLATGNTIYEGWATLGRWTTWYFAPYIVIWGFVYGAAAMAGTGLPLASLVPAGLNRTQVTPALCACAPSSGRARNSSCPPSASVSRSPVDSAGAACSQCGPSASLRCLYCCCLCCRLRCRWSSSCLYFHGVLLACPYPDDLIRV